MLSPAGDEVTTIARDGCVRAWYWDTVEQADPPEDDPYVELNPVAETCVWLDWLIANDNSYLFKEAKIIIIVTVLGTQLPNNVSEASKGHVLVRPSKLIRGAIKYHFLFILDVSEVV